MALPFNQAFSERKTKAGKDWIKKFDFQLNGYKTHL